MGSILNGLRGAFNGAQRARAARIERERNAPASIPDDHCYCTHCGHTGRPETHTPGHILVEIVLWLTFLLPGVIYTIWRHHKRHQACAKCGSPALIPHDAPRAVFCRPHPELQRLILHSVAPCGAPPNADSADGKQ